MSEGTPGEARGLFDSLKALVATLIAIVHTRLGLLSTELEEERDRLVSILVMMLVALFSFSLGTVLLTILVAAAYWDSHRLLALGGLTAFFLVVGLSALSFARHKLRTKPKLFSATLTELSKDRQELTERP